MRFCPFFFNFDLVPKSAYTSRFSVINDPYEPSILIKICSKSSKGRPNLKRKSQNTHWLCICHFSNFDLVCAVTILSLYMHFFRPKICQKFFSSHLICKFVETQLSTIVDNSKSRQARPKCWHSTLKIFKAEIFMKFCQFLTIFHPKIFWKFLEKVHTQSLCLPKLVPTPFVYAIFIGQQHNARQFWPKMAKLPILVDFWRLLKYGLRGRSFARPLISSYFWPLLKLYLRGRSFETGPAQNDVIICWQLTLAEFWALFQKTTSPEASAKSKSQKWHIQAKKPGFWPIFDPKIAALLA